MKTSVNGLNLIKKFEGFYPKAYLCPAKVPTIGYGTIRYFNGNKVKIGDVITEEQATIELSEYIKKDEAVINGLGLNLNQNQFDALISFTYNLGMTNFLSSTLLKKIRVSKNDPSIKNEFMKWVKAGGKTLNGLIRRREEEAKLYFK